MSSVWKSRAIYNNEFEISIVWDRQNIEGSDDDRAELCKWIDDVGLPAIRKTVKDEFLEPNEDRSVVFNAGKFSIKANPKQSYGYLYLTAEKS